MTRRLVAIVPAAGLSRRMGRPKLLLNLGNRTVIAQVVEAVRLSGIDRCLVVVRPDDAALIAEVATLPGAEVVIPSEAPLDMRASVECALRSLMTTALGAPPCDGWLLIPADHPTLHAGVVQELMVAWGSHPQQIAVPFALGRRGHPTIFPWSCVSEVFALPVDQGLNQLLRSHPERVREIPMSDERVLVDLDTPEDWKRLIQGD